jgi:hypothetical protein
MCQFKTSWENKEDYFNEIPEILIQLQEMENDGLVRLAKNSIEVTEAGKPYVRNICMAFDLLLKRKAPNKIILDDNLTTIGILENYKFLYKQIAKIKFYGFDFNE